MSLRESQEFFYNLCAKPDVIGAFKKNRNKVLKSYFHSKADTASLEKPSFERYQTYRDHIAIGFLGGISSAFPVIRSLVSEKEWNNLLNDFYLKRLSRSPIAREVYREFSLYLQKYRGALRKRFPYLTELAHYENLDLKLFYEQDKPAENFDIAHLDQKKYSSPEEIMNLIPILNPHQELRVYQWPVHKICRGFSTLKKVKRGNFPLLVYRNPQSLEVQFIESSPATAKLLKKMASGRTTIGRIFKDLLKESHSQNVENFVRECLGVIHFLNEKGVILGFKSKN